MQKKLLCAALVAATACANAAETTWSFTYRGFVNDRTGIFVPDAWVSGWFTGSDLDHDGIIVQEELSFFSTGRFIFLDASGTGCAQIGSPYAHCVVNSFSYKLTGELAYSTNQWFNDHDSGWIEYAHTGDHFRNAGYNRFSEWDYRYNWSDQTSLTISAAPVPEPAIALMLPAGLAMLLAARRQRQKISK